MACITLSIAAIGLAILATLGFRLTPEEGAAWLAAIATVAAVAAAIYAGLWAKETFRIEESRQIAAQERERSDQASKVSAWFVSLSGPQGGISPAEAWWETKFPTTMVVHLRNLSLLPVHDVRISVEVIRTDGPSSSKRSFAAAPMRMLVPTETERTPRTLQMSKPTPDVAQMYRAIQVTPMQAIAKSKRLATSLKGVDPTFAVELTLRFRDATNADWVRLPSGMLMGSEDSQHGRVAGTTGSQ